MIESHLNDIYLSLSLVHSARLKDGAQPGDLSPGFGHQTVFMDSDDLFSPQMPDFCEQFRYDQASAHMRLLFEEHRSIIEKSWIQLKDELRSFGPFFDGPLLNLTFSFFKSQNSVNTHGCCFYLFGSTPQSVRGDQSAEEYIESLGRFLRLIAALDAPTRQFLFSTDECPISASMPDQAYRIYRMMQASSAQQLTKLAHDDILMPVAIMELVSPKGEHP